MAWLVTKIAHCRKNGYNNNVSYYQNRIIDINWSDFVVLRKYKKKNARNTGGITYPNQILKQYIH